MSSIFKSKLTVDQAAEALYAIMGKDDKKLWLSQLSGVPELDIVRAEDELLLLDFFAVYFSLKFTRSPGWSDKGILIFENLFYLFANWLGRFWESKNAGTVDDAYRIVNARLKSYGAALENSSEDPDDIIHSIGLTFAAYAFCDDTSLGADGCPTDDTFRQFLLKIGQDVQDSVLRVGGDSFNYRLQTLNGFFDSHELL